MVEMLHSGLPRLGSIEQEHCSCSMEKAEGYHFNTSFGHVLVFRPLFVAFITAILPGNEQLIPQLQLKDG